MNQESLTKGQPVPRHAAGYFCHRVSFAGVSQYCSHEQVINTHVTHPLGPKASSPPPGLAPRCHLTLPKASKQHRTRSRPRLRAFISAAGPVPSLGVLGYLAGKTGVLRCVSSELASGLTAFESDRQSRGGHGCAWHLLTAPPQQPPPPDHPSHPPHGSRPGALVLAEMRADQCISGCLHFTGSTWQQEAGVKDTGVREAGVSRHPRR